MIKNDIPAKEIAANTEGHPEIMGVDITINNQQIIIYNMHCQQDRELPLASVDISVDNCMVVETSIVNLKAGDIKKQAEDERR